MMIHQDEGSAMPNIKKTQEKKLESNDDAVEAKESFKRHVINEAALASTNIKADNFDLDKSRKKSSDAMTAIAATNGLQAMLAAQMLSVHELQQRAMTYAHCATSLELQQYYTNSAVKLSNCFVQQTNALAKLQGIGGQKIVVERVDVHQGGQAIVGNIQGGEGVNERKC